MGYAIRNDLKGWRAVASLDEIGADEHFSETPVEILPEPLTSEQVKQLRLKAYADPVTGSDRYFAEAARMQAMSEEGWEIVRAAGVNRFQEIQEQYQWPE